MNKSLVLLAVAALGGAAWWFFAARGAQAGAAGIQYRTGKVERGEVVEGVLASGTVQPVVLVQVGTQITGVIEKLSADFNSKVTAGQTIAQLDNRRLAAQVASDEAAVARSRADLERVQAAALQAQADLTKARAMATAARADADRVQALLVQATNELARQQALFDRKLVSPSDLDGATATKASLAAQLGSARANIDQADAQVASAQASIQQDAAQIAVGQAAVKQSEAQLSSDKVNLAYATIVSPVDGTVVSRNVDVGQTVAASLQAPVLFTIAQDLTKVQVQVSVPEADIGRIHQGQAAHFTVDAYDDRGFDGVVSQVRLAATTVQNVVTYTVVVDASNPEGLLFPGMTASLTFEIQRSAKDALHVPSTALRLQVSPELLAATDGEKAGEKGGDKAAGDKNGKRGQGGAREKGAGGKPAGKRDQVYVLTADNHLRAIPVRTGISDAFHTVIEPLEPGALQEGQEVVTAVVREQAAATTNPFAPPRVGGGGRPR